MRSFALTLVAMISCTFANSQTGGDPLFKSPTKFDKFVAEKNISWACYVIDTLTTTEQDIAQLLLTQFNKNKLKVSAPLSFERGALEKIKYESVPVINKFLFPPATDNTDNDKSAIPYPVDSNVINVARILYMKDGRLNAYIPWVSTRMFITTSSGFFIGMSEFFSTAISTNHITKSSEYGKAKFLSRTKRMISANDFPKEDMLKEMYGQNLIQTILAGTKAGYSDAVDLDSGKVIPTQYFYNYLYLKNTVQVPVYDSLGNIRAYKTGLPTGPPPHFTHLEIVEEWFYDEKKNRLLCKIPEATLYDESVQSMEGGEERRVISAAFKIRFRDK